MDYLLKSSLLVIILVSFYYFFLQNETFFKSIRSYFLGGLFVATLLPLVEIPIYVEAVSNQLEGYYTTSTSEVILTTEPFHWQSAIAGIYLLGVSVLFLKLVLQFIALFTFLKKNNIQKKGSYKFVRTNQNIAPFSFFNTIAYNPEHFLEDELHLIVAHEKAHAKQLHSIDTILTQLLVILLWFNPFAWLLKKAVQQNLEFLADSEVSTINTNDRLYKMTLLKACTNNLCTDLSNNFYNSIIKNRIIMLQKNPSKKRNQFKYVLLVPILALFLFTFNTKTIAQEKTHNEVKVEGLKVELIIDKNSTDETLDSEAKTFKEEFGVKLTFKGVKRNADKEITSIKITAKTDKSSAAYKTSDGKPIKPIKISYDSEGNSLHINSLSEVHENHFTYKIKDKDGNISIKSTGVDKGDFVFINEDGESSSWTVKDKSNSDKSENIFIIKSDEHVWVEEDGAKKIIIKEIHEGDAEDHKSTVKEIDENGKGKNVVVEIKTIEDENVFFIQKGEHEVNKTDKKAKMVVFSNSGEQPLYIIDGKESDEKAMKELNPDNIASMNVLKGESALKKYGDKGKNGVIEITTKKE